jgi:hypothetical protein
LLRKSLFSELRVMAKKMPRRRLRAHRSEVHDAKRRREIAFHEAGHAVIGVVIGQQLRWVEVRRDELSDGGSRVGATDFGDVAIEDVTGKGEEVVRPILIQTLAGMAVEAWVNPETASQEYQAGTSDWAAGLFFATLSICEHVKTTDGRPDFIEEDFNRCLPQIMSMMEAARDEVARLAEENRAAIIEVAEMLVRKGRLEGHEVAAIVAAHRTPAV